MGSDLTPQDNDRSFSGDDLDYLRGSKPSFKRPPTNDQNGRWTFKRILILLIFLGGSILAGIGFGIIVTYLGEIPLVSDLKAYKPSLSTKIYDCHGQLITELFSEKRTLISMDDVPDNMKNAIIAIEDNNFYHHFGVDFGGVIRSAITNIVRGSYSQGFSTITMQLPRNMFLTREKTIERKIKEILLAFQIERTYTKREILEMYLNQIYLGSGAYGIEAAARKYFGKHAKDLNLPEAALIAGLPRAPNGYNPYRYPDRALKRRNLVLTQMQRLGYISQEEAIQAKNTPLTLSSVDVSDAPYFVEYVRQQLEERYGSNAIYRSGLKVFTTLDLNMQRMAQDAMNEGILDAEAIIKPHLQNTPGQTPETVQCALVLIEPATGEIKALIGGRDFQESKFNRAVQAERQPGSAFKPFVYATAFKQGYTQADIILDTPVVFKDDLGKVWKPENFSNRFFGPTTLRTALTHSRNVVTVKLLDKIGVNNVIKTARLMGIKSPLKPFLTLALGASEVNLLELVSAYGAFPNRGIRVEPYSIMRVEDSNGRILEDKTPLREEALDEATASIMCNVLQNVVNHGTGYTARRMGFKPPAGGKTGTTNDFTDGWFLGFTSEYVAGVWIGLDSHNSMGRGVTGGRVACPIWTKLMLKLYQDHTPPNFTSPDSVESVDFCKLSGLLANDACGKYRTTGAFAIGTAPTQHCDLHPDHGLPGSNGLNLNMSPDLADVNSDSETGETGNTSSPGPSSRSSSPAPAKNSPGRPPMF